MLKLKLPYFGHLMQRAKSLEKTPMMGKIEGKIRRDDRGCNGWMASLTQWTWVWVSSGSWWWTGKPGVLQSMGSQRVGYDLVTEQRTTNYFKKCFKFIHVILLWSLKVRIKRWEWKAFWYKNSTRCLWNPELHKHREDLPPILFQVPLLYGDDHRELDQRACRDLAPFPFPAQASRPVPWHSAEGGRLTPSCSQW